MFKIKLIKRQNADKISELPMGKLKGRKFIFDGDAYLIVDEFVSSVMLLLLKYNNEPFKYSKTSLKSLFTSSPPAYWVG